MKIKTRTYLKDLDKAYQAGYEAGLEDAEAAQGIDERLRGMNHNFFTLRDEFVELKREMTLQSKKKKKKKKYEKPQILGVVKVGSVCHDHEAKPAEAPTGSEAAPNTKE